MALVSMTVLGVLIFLITGSTSFWEEKRQLFTYLGDSAALAPGANVPVAAASFSALTQVRYAQPNWVSHIDADSPANREAATMS